MYIRLLAVRPGQQAHGHRCWQQERVGRAGTATGISRDRLSEGGAAAEVLPGSSVPCLVKKMLTVESVDC